MLRKFFLSDAGASLFLHGLKSVVALYINWIVLAQFSEIDYVTWSVTSSILIVATASDLGIGQYAVTRFIHSDIASWPTITRGCLFALLPLSIGAIILVAAFIDGPSLLYKFTMASFLGVRVLSIPFGAVLNAVNQFKIRKAIEVGAYIGSAIVIYMITTAGGEVTWALLTMNAAFLLGGLVTVVAASGYMTISDVFVGRSRSLPVMDVYKASIPFMVNNLSGLLTYGGFIWISSFFLGTNAVAKLSVLHTFVLMNAYQVYDVFLKSRQADLIAQGRLLFLKRVNAYLMFGIPIIFLILGGEVFKLITRNLEFIRLEVFLFAIFISIELGYLLIQSLAQVRWDLSKNLGLYSAIRVASQALALLVFSLVPLDGGLVEYIGLLVATSMCGYWLCFQHLDSRLRQIE